MSVAQKYLASHILEEHFGRLVEKVGTYLVGKGPRALRDIIHETGLIKEEAQRALCSLIQHRLVNFEKNKKDATVYNVCLSNILLCARFSRYTFSAKTLFGEEAELIVEHILQHGADMMSRVVRKVSGRYGADGDDTDVRSTFAELVRGHFLKRVRLPLLEFEANADMIAELEEHRYELPPGMDVQGSTQRKRKRSIDEVEQRAKRQRISESSAVNDDLPDDGIMWHVNFSRFHQNFLDEAIVSSVHKRIDESAAMIVQTMLKMDELPGDSFTPASRPVSLFEIAKHLKSDVDMENTQLSHYLTLLVDDETGFLTKVGDSGGGTYSVRIYLTLIRRSGGEEWWIFTEPLRRDLQKCLAALCRHTVESVVQERFGSKYFRIFRLLITKEHLEQKQIGELAMIPSKDAKEMLYKLFAEKFITLQEVPRASDYAPSKTIYLFSVNLKQLSRMLLERSYQALGNLMRRRQSETQKQSRLIEKQERLDATIAALKAQHGEDEAVEAIAELEELMTPADRNQLSKLKTTSAKLEQSEIQVDETVFILSQYVTS